MNKCTTDLLHNIMSSIIATKTCDNRVKAVGNFTNKTTSQLRPLQAGPEVVLIVRFHCIYILKIRANEHTRKLASLAIIYMYVCASYDVLTVQTIVYVCASYDGTHSP